MKYFFLLLFTFSCMLQLGCHSNNEKKLQETKLYSLPNAAVNNLDSLKKYSYLIVCRLKGDTGSVGTGFLVRYGERKFLVSASHVFTGISAFSKQKIQESDSLSVRFNIKNSKYGRYFTFSVKKIQDTIKPFFYYEEPDAFVYELKNFPDDLEFNSIEHLIDISLLKDVEAPKVFSWGFPVDLKIWSNKILDVDHFQPTYYSGEIANDPTKPVVFNKKIVDRYTLVSKPGTYRGASGSPAYFICTKLINGVKQKSVVFAGLFYGTNTIGNYCTLVRPEIIANLINKRIGK